MLMNLRYAKKGSLNLVYSYLLTGRKSMKRRCIY